jgi:hypothetical protein
MNQLTGRVTKAHQKLLRLAPIDEWKIPKHDDTRPIREAAYAVPPESKTDEDENSEVNPQPTNELLSLSEDESSESEVPLSKLEN